MSDQPLRIWLAVDGRGVRGARAFDATPGPPWASSGWRILGPYVLEAETTARHMPIVGEVD